MLIYKIFRATEWAELQSAGQSQGAPVDLADGYIHFSTAETVAETLARYFADESDLMLIAVETDGLTPLKWEPARGGTLFPHLYRALTLQDVVWARAIGDGQTGHNLPDLT
jgi:uncharacterized protein (DUF952 family)